jgi:hypothetical protein
MNATDINRELAQLAEQRRGWKKKLTAAEAERDHLLALPSSSFSRSEVDEATAVVARFERRIAELDDRADALRRVLPTADEVREGKAARLSLAADLDAAKERYREAWSRITALAMELDAAGDELSRARRESQRLAIAISDHDRRFALENEPTPGWEPPTAEAKVLYLLQARDPRGGQPAPRPRGSARFLTSSRSVLSVLRPRLMLTRAWRRPSQDEDDLRAPRFGLKP